MDGLALDSSVVVKWFKEGEEFEKEALRLRDDILSFKVDVSASEMVPLEVCRGLVKVGYPLIKSMKLMLYWMICLNSAS